MSQPGELSVEASRGERRLSDPAAGRRLRVLWLIKSLDRGGAEKLLTLMARARDRERVHYDVAYLLSERRALVPELQREGIAVHGLRGRREWNLSWAPRLRRLLRARRYDVVHLHSPYVAGIARLVLRTIPRDSRPAVVSTEHLPWSGYVVATRLLNALTCGLDDARIAVSEGVRDSIPRALSRGVRVIVHGVEVDEVRRYLSDRQEVRQELGVGPDEVLVGTVANYRPQKRYEDLLAAAGQLSGDGLPVRFAAVGHGPLEGEIRRIHRSMGLDGRFLLLGHREEAARIMAGFDVFVLASSFEGLSLALMEALALGLPTVATAVSGISECVRDGIEGILVPPRRPDRLAAALEDLVRDPNRRATMGRAAFRRAEAFDITRGERAVEEVYEGLVGVKAPRTTGPAATRQA